METMLNGTVIWKDKRVLTKPKSHLGIRLRHLQKQSVLRRTFIFAFQMSNKIIALLVIFRQKKFQIPKRNLA